MRKVSPKRSTSKLRCNLSLEFQCQREKLWIQHGLVWILSDQASARPTGIRRLVLMLNILFKASDNNANVGCCMQIPFMVRASASLHRLADDALSNLRCTTQTVQIRQSTDNLSEIAHALWCNATDFLIICMRSSVEVHL